MSAESLAVAVRRYMYPSLKYSQGFSPNLIVSSKLESVTQDNFNHLFIYQPIFSDCFFNF